MPGGTHLQLYSMYAHTGYIWHFTQTQGVTCRNCRNALAVYTKHGLSACISKQVIAREVPRLRQGRPRKMESLRFLTVMSTILPGTAVTYNDTIYNITFMCLCGVAIPFLAYHTGVHAVSCEGLVFLTRSDPPSCPLCV